MTSDVDADAGLLDAALRAARDTRLLELSRGARTRTAAAFASLFGAAMTVVIADENTFAAAGRDVVDALKGAAQPSDAPIILSAPGLYAEYSFVDDLRTRLAATDAIPIAVGSGTINDLVKLAAHQCGRPYLAVATAASMDGYTAYGASITRHGSKQTFDCSAPRGVIADLDVIADAPPAMNAWGYADLVAKCPAGADWIVADFLGVEPIDRRAWDAVQLRLREWMANPAGVKNANIDSLRRLTIALMMTGFAMQSSLSSRCASGAEHQFSHLWDMEHHEHEGRTPSHGLKVGVGSLASVALYEALAAEPLDALDVEAAVSSWPTWADMESEIAELFPSDELAAKAREESTAKYIERDALRAQLIRLKQGWPELSQRLDEQLVPRTELRDMLRAAGAADSCEQIGIPRERLRRSYVQAFHIRRRFTVLDLARRAGRLEPALDRIFSPSRSEAQIA
jgi:glycerol-1-phosphate dehydrogenase [NAD(P)+]